jgi:hypothetical protein
MKKKLILKPVDMTEEVMQDLEKGNLIVRLCPDHHKLPAKPGETIGETIYESDNKYGGHMLITVTVNRSTFAAFGTHPANEEFLFIGNPDTKQMYLVIALLSKEELDRQISKDRLTADDFFCLRVKYNDPNVSFFTMLADVPHGEAVADEEGLAPSFYVTEPSNMGIELTSFGNFELCLPGQ